MLGSVGALLTSMIVSEPLIVTGSLISYCDDDDDDKGWGLSVKLGKHSAIWGKLGTALQAYTLSPCTKFPPNPTSRKVNT